MKIFILVTLIALSVEAHIWNHHRNSRPLLPVLHDHIQFRNGYHQNRFSRYPQHNYPEVNFNIDQFITDAEWICKNVNTGATLILPSKTEDQRDDQREDQTTKPPDHSSLDSVETKHQDNWNQENTNTHNAHVVTEDVKKAHIVKNFGGEGLIDIRLAA
ncbi:PREDICTED: uncharacterized protein LOC107067669 [Polistes dominula]|uniref:Uncharacterized protein LOC107067669 n=1 Tax=Polistes dominula TaxID=743375 RepID=A0ABM1IF71_POLDO|nr:PREDICTED: uncharacterized protein LOC107067669 [Polistes dominula]